MTDEDKRRIDAMSLDDMQHALDNTPSFAWPFKDRDTGDYFYERYYRLGDEQRGHLDDPN